MWPFSKKWAAPEPQLAMLVSLTKPELPSVIQVSNPTGADGAVPGMAGPAEGEPTAETMTTPMKAGHYVAISASGGHCTIELQRADGQENPLSLDGPMLEASGLTEETLAKFNQPAWRATIVMAQPGKEVRETVAFATRLARRLAALGDGIVMDICAYRFFGPDGWPVEEPLPELDSREHVHVHIESENGNTQEESWFHTHGLVKFGRPEMEIYNVPAALDQTAYAMLLDLAQYVITTAIVEPGQTCGDPNQPFYAREGTKNREGHWEDRSVLELVDVDDRRRPVTSGAPKALQARASQDNGES